MNNESQIQTKPLTHISLTSVNQLKELKNKGIDPEFLEEHISEYWRDNNPYQVFRSGIGFANFIDTDRESEACIDFYNAEVAYLADELSEIELQLQPTPEFALDYLLTELEEELEEAAWLVSQEGEDF